MTPSPGVSGSRSSSLLRNHLWLSARALATRGATSSNISAHASDLSPYRRSHPVRPVRQPRSSPALPEDPMSVAKITQDASPRPLRLKILTIWLVVSAVVAISTWLEWITLWFDAHQALASIIRDERFHVLKPAFGIPLFYGQLFCGLTTLSYQDFSVHGGNNWVLFGTVVPHFVNGSFYIAVFLLNVFLAYGVWHRRGIAHTVAATVLCLEIVNHIASFVRLAPTDEWLLVGIFWVPIGILVSSIKLFLVYTSKPAILSGIPSRVRKGDVG